MKKVDLAYLAGFFDGEGCISIKRNRNRQRPTTQYQLEVIVASTDEWACRRLQFNFSGNIRKVDKKDKNWKPYWVWRASSITAGVFLDAIYPYLHLKRDRAQIAIEFQMVRQNRHSRQTQTETELAIAEAQRILIATANKRGRRV